jgi:hypothetical protein
MIGSGRTTTGCVVGGAPPVDLGAEWLAQATTTSGATNDANVR